MAVDHARWPPGPEQAVTAAPIAALLATPWVTWLDLDVEVNDDGTCVATFDRPKPEHLVAGDQVLPAVAYGIAEVAATHAALVRLEESLRPVTVGFVTSGSIGYRGGANAGVVATAKVHPARSIWVADLLRRNQHAEVRVPVELTDLQGEVVGSSAFWLGFRLVSDATF